MFPPLGKEGRATATCKTYLVAEKFGLQVKNEINREKQEFTPYFLASLRPFRTQSTQCL
tara:strand:- start:411 stop:587 length:177 start_codon:yes stop_codon:yes gene_type:complete